MSSTPAHYVSSLHFRLVGKSNRTATKYKPGHCDVNSPRLAEFYQGLGYEPRGEQDFYVAHQDFHVTVLRHELRLD